MTHTRWMARVVGLGVALATITEAAPGAEEASQPAAPVVEEVQGPVAIQANMDVGLEYTLTVDGSVVDTTDSRGPFHYIHGQGQLIPGLERELAGLHVGEAKDVAVSPEEGYGAVDPAAFIEVPKDQLPHDVAPTVGMILQGVNPDGRNFRAKINEVKENSVVLDLNHPLAGKTLSFQVKVTEISPAAPPGQ